MLGERRNDDQVMSLVGLALSLPPGERRSYLKNACGDDTALFDQVWGYVEWEDHMQGFLLDPLLPQASPECPIHPGDTLHSRFEILRKVAEGGMGFVFEARDNKLDRRIALKCAKHSYGRLLASEVRNASTISHPNVCKIFEIHTAYTGQGEVDFVTMEFLEGQTLAERLTTGPLPETEAREVALQLCAGLAEAHRNHVIHGDLKSNNVILTRTPDGSIRAVITDFGMARGPVSRSGIGAGAQGGTPAYMSPEMWNGEPASVASDIYALGIVLFELLAGSHPHETVLGSDEAAPTGTILEPGPTPEWMSRLQQPPRPLHPKWDPVIARCLRFKPEERFASAAAVAEALGPSRTRRRVLVSLAAVVLAALTGLVTYQRATVPKIDVRLTLHPEAGLSSTLLSETKAKLQSLKGTAATRFRFLGDAAGAAPGSHTLNVALHPAGDTVALDARVTNSKTGSDVRVWHAVYRPSELRHAPTALAGFVTAAFELPAVAGSDTVNDAAKASYTEGLARIRRNSGLDDALALFTTAAEADPDSPLTHAALAEAQWFKYYNTRDKTWLDRATESARQAELRNLDLAAVHRIAGLLKANAGWYEQAEADYRRAIQLEPANGDGYRRLGMALQAASQMEPALSAYRQAIEADATDYRNYLQAGAFYWDVQTDNEKAAGYFRKAVELAPNEAEPHRQLGGAYLDLGRYADAEAEFRRALQIAESPYALHSLALTLLHELRPADAIPYAKRAVEINPSQFLRWRTLGAAYRMVGKTAEAEAATRKALELVSAELETNPRDAYRRAVLGYLLAQTGDPRRAESEVAQAQQLAPSDGDVKFFCVLAYEAMHRRDAALAVLAASPKDKIAAISRWPETPDLRNDPRFQQLLIANQIK